MRFGRVLDRFAVVTHNRSQAHRPSKSALGPLLLIPLIDPASRAFPTMTTIKPTSSSCSSSRSRSSSPSLPGSSSKHVARIRLRPSFKRHSELVREMTHARWLLPRRVSHETEEQMMREILAPPLMPLIDEDLSMTCFAPEPCVTPNGNNDHSTPSSPPTLGTPTANGIHWIEWESSSSNQALLLPDL